MKYKEIIEYILNNFDDYIIQGIAIELEEYLNNKRKKQYTPLQIKRMEFNRMNKKIVLERDKYRCVKCGTYKNLSIDHIIPLAKNGTNELSNLQTLCLPHNLSKGKKPDTNTEPNL